MLKSSGRPSAAALFVSAALACARPVLGAPTAAVVAPSRVIEPHMSFIAPRVERAFVPSRVAAPLRFAVQPAPAAPIKALPLPAPPTQVKAIPAFLPRLGFAALPALADSERCGTPRSDTIFSALPASPFTPIACERDLGTSSANELPTSLVPGRNKNALYRGGYAPHSLDDL